MKTVTITINIKAGSKAQEDFARKSLALMMDAFTIYFKTNHKKNDTSYTLKEE